MNEEKILEMISLADDEFILEASCKKRTIRLGKRAVSLAAAALLCCVLLACAAAAVVVTGIVHFIGAFAMDLGGLDYLVFTAGIGEHSDYIRARVCEKLSLLGAQIDEEKNRRSESDISAEGSAVKVLVIPTNEELGIARRTFEYV